MNRYARQLQEHLKLIRPKEYARLQESGQLVPYLERVGAEAENMAAAIESAYYEKKLGSLPGQTKWQTEAELQKILKVSNEARQVADEQVTHDLLLPRAEEDDNSIGLTGAYEDNPTGSPATNRLA